MWEKRKSASAVRENSSLTSMPLRPYFLNPNGDRIAAPVFRSVRRLVEGRGLPWYLSSIGLGSNVSTCDGPPFMNRKMTLLARGPKWGGLGARGFGAAPDVPPSEAARAAQRGTGTLGQLHAGPEVVFRQAARRSEQDQAGQCGRHIAGGPVGAGQ